jgi:hypothetical protein
LRALGKGRFCTAFESNLNEVVKIFQAADTEVATNEMSVLRMLANNNVKFVPVVLGELLQSNCGKFTALVVTPVGIPVLPIHGGRRTNGADWANIVSSLQSAHGLRIMHRDVKPTNMFITDAGVILNDWGSSCALGVRICWVGTLGYSEAAEDDGFHTPLPASDLTALVRSVYSMMTQELPPCDDSRSQFWEARLREPTLWHDCLRAAQTCNYEDLKALFCRLK